MQFLVILDILNLMIMKICMMIILVKSVKILLITICHSLTHSASSSTTSSTQPQTPTHLEDITEIIRKDTEKERTKFETPASGGTNPRNQVGHSGRMRRMGVVMVVNGMVMEAFGIRNELGNG